MDSEIKKYFLDQTGLHLRSVSEDEHDQIWRSKGEIYRHALMKVRETDPLAITPTMVEETFPKAILGFFERETDMFSFSDTENGDEKKELQCTFDLRPDLFSIDIKAGEIRLHEIEDTHSVEHEKLRKVMKAFQVCDEFNVSFRLFVYDRYGLSKREIDLPFIVFTDYSNDLFTCTMPGVKAEVHGMLGLHETLLDIKNPDSLQTGCEQHIPNPR